MGKRRVANVLAWHKRAFNPGLHAKAELTAKVMGQGCAELLGMTVRGRLRAQWLSPASVNINIVAPS